MKLLAVFSFVLIATLVAGQDSIGGCLDKLVNQVKANPNGACGYFEDYIKCVIRVTDILNTDGAEEELQKLESDVNTQLKNDGLNCNIDISEIFEEMKKENTGSTTSPIGWLVAMVTSFLVMLQQF